MNATLIYSCKPLRIAYEPSPVTKLFNSIIKEKFIRTSSRVHVKNGKYYYIPSADYKQTILRIRQIKF
jgi:hypothetical protein